jgi:hypothetical protein
LAGRADADFRSIVNDVNQVIVRNQPEIVEQLQKRVIDLEERFLKVSGSNI